jgi:hypothetical protein
MLQLLPLRGRLHLLYRQLLIPQMTMRVTGATIPHPSLRLLHLRLGPLLLRKRGFRPLVLLRLLAHVVVVVEIQRLIEGANPSHRFSLPSSRSTSAISI